MPASSAKAELQRLGFSAVTETSRHSSTVARGHVITTSPPPGTRQASNKPITLVVSSGHAPVKVPSLEGDTEQEATAALETDGFKVNPVSQASKTVGQGLVIKTSPPAGQEAAYGSTVTLYVSTGRPDVTIPSDLIGETPSQAGQQLGNLGLNVTQASEPSTSVPAGQVDRTSPPVGTSVPVGSTVTVYVSTGPPQVQVPNLSGDTQAQAQQALSSAGLKGSFSTQPTTNPADNGVVISQSPAPNTSVNQGSTVDVVIGSYQSTSTTSSTSTTTTSSGSGSGSGSSGLPLPGGHGPGKSA
jgi:beta-lactam-binding protein with PASTA domain